MAMYADGEALDTLTAPDEAAARQAFDTLVNKYAGPLQKAMYAAHLIPGHKYTLVYLGEFGFPVSRKITFHSMSFTTYAQYSDVVRLVFTPYRKRSLYSDRFYYGSLLIFAGWQQLEETAWKDVLRDDGQTRVTKTKYPCFSASYIEDLENAFKDPVMIYKNYKTGVNGNLYA
jgi:hypothetical protein